MHSTSRVVAGGPITNDVYKCHTKSVAQSIADGDYGVWEPTEEEQAHLEAIHPQGVCDYSQRSVGYPGEPVPPTVPAPGPVSPTTTVPEPTTSTTTTVPGTTTTTDAPTTSAPPSPDFSPSRPGSDPRPPAADRGGRGALARTGLGVLGLAVIGFALFGSGSALTRRSRR